MESIATALILLVAVVVSGWLSRACPFPVPLPLFQIALGVFLAAATDLGVTLQPEVFFLLFLPPLLFLDGWRIPKEGLFRDKGTILELALGLVLLTVLGVGYFVHWLIPAMPLAVAFALAAVISPTDPVAVSAIAKRVPIPHRLMHILEGESLLNDASGLVCMRFAVAAALTGTFSLTQALGSFLWVAFGGMAIGVVVTWSISKIKYWVTRQIGEESGGQILISLLMPFGAYILAEHFHCSGILAAVAAGVTMSYTERSGRAEALTRMRRTTVWDMIAFTGNGIIFVLLGEQFPQIVNNAAHVVSETGHREPIWLLVYILAINGALAILRFLWVWLSFRFVMFREARKGLTVVKPSWRLVAAASLAGVRGAITLAGVLTLPLALNDGTAFPARDLAILLAAGVIVVSLITASVTLPFLLKDLKLPPEPTHEAEEEQARIEAAHAAIKAIELAQHNLAEHHTDPELFVDAGARIMELYRQRIEHGSKTADEAAHLRLIDRIERDLRIAGIRAERDTIHQLARARQLPDQMVRKLVRELDLQETRFVA